MLSQVNIAYAVTALCSYLLGCFNGSIVSSININKRDVRDYGSKNAGLTNFFRTFGTSGLLLVLVSDTLKAALSLAVACGLLAPFGAERTGMLFAALFCMLGHCFPAYYDFRGGKGALSAAISALVFDWRIGLSVLGVFLVVVLISKMVSLGSIIGGFCLPVLVWLFGYEPKQIILAALMSAMLVFMHRTNITRILNGSERRFSFKAK